ncbi:MAG: DUF6702 family protein [Bacteroidia bacterium]
MKLIIVRTALFFLLILALSGFVHPFYFSLTQIDHNPETQSLEITLKLFTTDIEQALEANGTGRLNLGAEKELGEADRYIETYLRDHLELKTDGQLLEYEFLGKEVELDVVWCYVEVLSVPELKQLEIKNTLLIEMFEEQQNVVQIKVGNQKKSALLRKGSTTETIIFD